MHDYYLYKKSTQNRVLFMHTIILFIEKRLLHYIYVIFWSHVIASNYFGAQIQLLAQIKLKTDLFTLFLMCLSGTWFCHSHFALG